MNIPLSQKHQKLIERKVKSGDCTGAAEVVREALRVLEARDRVRVEALRREVAVAIADIEAGRSTITHNDREMDAFFDVIKARGRKRLAAARRGRAA